MSTPIADIVRDGYLAREQAEPLRDENRRLAAVIVELTAENERLRAANRALRAGLEGSAGMPCDPSDVPHGSRR